MLITNFAEVVNHIGKTIAVGGFTHSIRDHGGLIFIDLRSENDLLQCVIDPERNPEVFKQAEQIHSEYVLKISGIIQKRTEETINPNLPTGQIELSIETLEITAKAKQLPFDIHAEDKNLAGEDVRLKYRYLDFRREKLKKLMWLRHNLVLKTRNWFADEGFIEVHTPILANSSPEGARDYLVPSRLHPGKFYALPQAPQQFKQLLMVGGFNKYFQIAPCFRDEDPRADRAVGDFYQIDAEIAWADEDKIYELNNRFIKEVLVQFSDKKLMHSDMPRINYDEAMNKYGSDRPDLRYDLAWQDAKPVFRNTDFKVFADLCEPLIKQDWEIENLEIGGDRVVLKPVSMDYATDIFEEFTPEITRYLGVKSPEKIEETESFVQKSIKENAVKTELILTILDKKTGEFLGMFGLHKLNTPTIKMGVWLKKSAHGNKYGQEAAQLAKTWLDESLNYQEIVYDVDIENISSQKVAESIGGVLISKTIEQKTNESGNILNSIKYKIVNPSYKPSNTRIQALHIPGAVDKFSRSDLDKVQDIGRQFGLPGIAYIQYFEDGAKSPIFKFLGEEKSKELQEYFGAKTGDLILFIANSDKNIVFKAQNQMRQHIAKKLDLIDENLLCYVWIENFPFFEKDEKTGKVTFSHNPFSSWQGDLNTLLEAEKTDTLLNLKARQYDIAVNGYEVLSGGIRNTNPEAIKEVFRLLGYSEEETRESFGHMFEAYECGAPVHGGFAWGLPRSIMVLTGEPNIREVIPFPKNGSGIDAMTNSPSSVSQRQLKELEIKFD